MKSFVSIAKDMASSVASPPRGAPLRSLNPFGGAATSTEPGASVNCRNYLWTFGVLLLVWAALTFLKPSFVRNKDGSTNYRSVFWITLVVTVVVVVGLCLWKRRDNSF
jgi:hypothetical protein